MGLFWFVVFVMNYSLTVAADSYYRCYSNGNSSSDSDYINLRNSQLFQLADFVKDQGGFYTASTVTSSPGPVPDCLGLCRKDLISSDTCHTCISISASDVTRNCPIQNEVVAWGEDAGCIVRCFSSNSRSDDTQPSEHECNDTSVPMTMLSQFGRTLANLTAKLAVKAAKEGSSSSFSGAYSSHQYFAAVQEKLGDLSAINAAGYCIPSLSAADCTACLKAAANQTGVLCDGKKGAKIFMPSCVLRYELYPFYMSAAAAAPLSVPISSSSDVRKRVHKGNRTAISTIVIPIVAVVTLILFITVFGTVLKRRERRCDRKDDTFEAESMESCFEFSFDTIRVATNDFSESNKLGQGGYGAVFKGKLPNGLQVAVKRLTRYTAHSEVEFKNEVQLVASLHHKNLVRLVGFCVGVKERILMYELAPNGSLDHILFVPSRRENLTWKIRYNIIQGIARGLLYLHEESQLRIIHRDLKASNVLLDETMNPKISDFGTARLFVEDQGSASRIVGTYGYMPPEYAKFGKLSTKVDVFSFGVLLLEIVSGRKNNTSDNPKRSEHLLSKAWKCWTMGQIIELIDPKLVRESGQSDDITRCIHIGLLCVQEQVACRPTMNEVVLMLEGCSQSLPPPLKPAYLMEIISDEPSKTTMEKSLIFRINELETNHPTRVLLSSSGSSSVNEVSFTHTYPGPR